MAGKLAIQKASGGVLNVTATDGVTSTDLVLPLSGTVLSNDSGVVNIAGVGARITGDFSNSTDSSRISFETSTANSFTVVNSFPNGTGMLSSFRAFNTAQGLNSAFTEIYCDNAQSLIRAGRSGTGSYLPMTFSTGGAERMRIDTSGNVLITGSGGLGYGTGSGGTVTQVTSKSTSVTLNKPSGQITMNNAALAAGSIVQFNLLNSLVLQTDCIEITLRQSSSVVPVLIELTWSIENGLVQIGVRNNHISALSEALVLNFTIIKGANS